MMLRGDDQVSHPRILERADPAVRVEFDGVELAGNLSAVDGERDLCLSHDVLGVTAHRRTFPISAEAGIHAPVDEHPEASLAPPRESLVARLHRAAPPGN